MIWNGSHGILPGMVTFKEILWALREWALFFPVELPRAVVSLIRDDRLPCERDVPERAKFRGAPKKRSHRLASNERVIASAMFRSWRSGSNRAKTYGNGFFAMLIACVSRAGY